MKSLFIFSLPRSGSTLLQRSLAAFPEIATTAEPWILLPSFFALRRQGVYSIYGHRSLVTAHEDVIAGMRGEMDGYYAVLNAFMREFHGRLVEGDHEYFLDKTPRYHLICDEIIKAVPDGKFIFLWRHPLAVAASIINTWGGGKWNLYRYWIDFYAGMEAMIRAYENHRDSVLAVQYEKLLMEPEETIRSVMRFLDLSVPDEMPAPLREIQGRMGDPTGVREFSSISQAPLERWKSSFRNPLRRSWARSYLKWLGDDRLSMMGYDPEAMREDLKHIAGVLPGLPLDMVRMPIGELYNYLEPHIVKDKIKSILKLERAYCHR